MADPAGHQAALGFPLALHCPYCGGDLEASLTAGRVGPWGTLRCPCYRYPVLEGIPILRQMSSSGSAVDPVVRFIDQGDLDRALAVATDLDPPRRFPAVPAVLGRRLEAFVPNRPMSFDRGLGLTLRQTRTARYADYLYQRYANNSFMAASVLISLLDGLPAVSGPAPVALDLPSGIGHASFLLAALYPGLRVIAADYDFASLRIARRYIAPEASLACLDANLPLPFPTSSIDVGLCLDGLHYIRAKRSFVGEIDRLLARHGVWLLPHLHSAAGHNVAPGVPLRPEGYAALLSGFEHRIVSEARLLECFARLDSFDPGASSPAPDDPALAAVAARTAADLTPRRHLSTILARPSADLGLNPIYRSAPEGTDARLRLVWPDDAMRRECATAAAVLASELWLSQAEVAALTAPEAVATGGQLDPGRLRELIRRFVVVPLPSGYRKALIGQTAQMNTRTLVLV